MSWGAVIAGVAAVAGGVISSKGAKKGAQKSADAQIYAAELGIEEQRLAREALEKRLQPFADLGSAATPYLQQLMGMPTKQSRQLQKLLGDAKTTGSLAHTKDRLEFFENRLEHGNPDWRQKLQLQAKIRELKRRLRLDGNILERLQKDPLAQARDPLPDLPQALDPSTLPGSMDLSQLPAAPTALDRSQLPGQGQVLDRSQLPAAGTAFGPESFKDNPMLDFVLKEGFRGIREGAAGRGRVPDRDLVEFAQGTASTLLPALQAQQFSQQQALRGQAVGEQARQFGQQQDLRGQAVSEQAAQFGQLAGLRGQSLAEQQAIRNQALGEQAQRFGQLGGLRESAISEQQRSISNLQSLLGMGQSAAAGQGAAGITTGTNISNLLGNIGTAQAQGALGAAQAQQAMGGNIAGLGGLLGGLINTRSYQRPLYADGGQQAGPFDASGRF